MDDFLIIIASFLCSLGWILFITTALAQPTELPNGCILYEDAIYCVQEVAE